jgi:hypothetical protein
MAGATTPPLERTEPDPRVPDNTLAPTPPTIVVTRTLDRMFVLMKRRFWLIYGITIVVYVPFFFYNLAVRQFQISVLEGASPLFMRTELLAGMLAGLAVFAIAWIFLWPLGTMAATTALARSYLGQETTIWRSYREVLGLLGPTILLMLVMGIGLLVGYMLCVVPGVILGLMLTVVFPVLAVEERRRLAEASASGGVLSRGYARAVVGAVAGSIRRSAALMRGNYWPVMLVLICLWCVKMALAYGISLTSETLLTGTSMVEVVVYAIVQFAGQLFIAPLNFISAVVIYFELRNAREGFDLELMAEDLAARVAPPAPSHAGEGA